MRRHLHWLSRTKRPHCAGSYHIHCKFFLELGADKWRRPQVFHAVSDTCIHRWRLLSVEEQTNKAHGSYMQWQQPACNASFYYICRGDRRRSHASCMWRQQPAFTATEVEFANIPAAGRTFCDSDVRAVMHVSLALLICHDRWKGHHNYMQHIQSIWQRRAMGQLRLILPSRHTGGGLRILWQWPSGRYACFSGFLDTPRSLKRSPQLHATHSIDMAT